MLRMSISETSEVNIGKQRRKHKKASQEMEDGSGRTATIKMAGRMEAKSRRQDVMESKVLGR